MADLGVGGVSGASRSNNGGTRLAPGGTDQPPRVMTPSDIMARRRERELRRAEEEARRKAEEQRRLSAERRAVAAGVAGGGGGSRRSTERPEEAGSRVVQRGSGGSTRQQVEDNTPTRGQGDTGAPLRMSGGESSIPQPVASTRSRAQSVTQQGQPRPVMPPTTRGPTLSNPQPTSQAKPTPTTAAAAGTERDSYNAAKAQTSQSTSQTRNGNTSSFPHAFERWEQLSSHWEGLTNYWIKRLESNSSEIKNQPINQQLARQVTDLSAAGANLFHAVVELQRLRASSERKFQRWFHETRSEQERTQDKIAKLEAELAEEREARKSDVRNGTRVSADSANAKIEEALAYKHRADDQMKEMRRELQISRDEARRGWEEIGRMEQAERDRTYSLKRGQPTLVGGVQVVPMPQAASSRQASSSRERQSQRPAEGSEQREGRTAYANYEDVRSEADTDPYTDGGVSSSRLDAPLPLVPDPRQAQPQVYQTSASSSAAAQAARTATVSQVSPQRPVVVSTSRPSPGRYEQQNPTSQPAAQPFYQQHGSGTALHEELMPRTTEADERSDVRSDTFSEEEYELDEHGRIRRDAYGNPIPYRSEEEMRRRQRYAEEAQQGLSPGGPPAPMPPPTSVAYPPSSNGGHPAYAGGQPDYSGAEYGDGYGGWGGVPRHHHPTRLSDVLEEDERSRTSPSRASERSRGFQ